MNTYFASMAWLLLIIPALILLAILYFEIVMFIHVIKNKAISDETRVLWILGMVFVHPLVAIAYYFTDYKKG